MPAPLRGLFAVVFAIAGCAYAISAWQVFGFAKHVWHLPVELCFAAAIVADLLSLAGLFATYLLRRAKAAVQLYAWFVFLAMTALSIAAAESYATWRFASPAARPDVTFDARVASAAIVIALALAAHLLVICRNHLTPEAEPPAVPEPAPKAKAVPAPAPKPTGPQPEAPAAPVVRKERPETGKTQVKAPVKTRKDDGKTGHRDALVRDIIAGRKTTLGVADSEGVSVRAVQLWVKAYHERHPKAPESVVRLFPAETLAAVTSTNVAPVNGNSPEVSVNR
jgi:hypothetical protein